MPLQSISSGIWISNKEEVNLLHNKLLSLLKFSKYDHLFRVERSNNFNTPTIIEFFYICIENRSYTEEIEKKAYNAFSVCTHWLMKQESNIFKKFSAKGLNVTFEIGGWLDNDNQLYDFLIPPELLFELGRVGLGIEMTLNDHHR